MRGKRRAGVGNKYLLNDFSKGLLEEGKSFDTEIHVVDSFAGGQDG